MQETADVIRALADLIQAIVWPVVAIVLVFLIRGEVPGLARRTRRVVVRRGDREVEVNFDAVLETADRLNERSEEFEREIRPPSADTGTVDVPPIAPATRLWPPALVSETAEFDPGRSIEEGLDPRLIVIRLDREIEREARAILATFAHDSNWLGVPTLTMLERLRMPETIRTAAAEFRQVRSAVVHGRASLDDAVRAVDIGTRILDALRRTGRNVHTVRAVDIPLYADEAGTKPRGVRGVMIETHASDSPGPPAHQVFPTSRENYRVGATVTWEWGDRSWGPSWYRDPQSGELVKAFDGSVEFAGRELTELD